jgi:rod shape-determining protein MreD
VKALRVLAGLLAALLGTFGIGAAQIPFPPDLFMVSVADAARGGTVYRAMLAGLSAGLLEDLLRTPPRLLGLHAFTKVLVGYALATAETRFVVEKPSWVAGLLAGAVVAESLTLSLLLAVFRGEPFALAGGKDLAARALSTAAVGAAIAALVRIPWKARLAARRRRRIA